MKISYRNTALNLLDKWDEEINIPTPHKYMSEEEKKNFGTSILKGIEKTGELFRKKIQYVSQPFIEAYMKGKYKLANVFDKEEIEESGTFIWQAGSYTHTNFYYLKTTGKGDDWKAEYMFIQFSKFAQNDFKSIDICISGKETDGVFEEKTFIWDGHYKNGCNHSYYLSFLVSFLCFIKHVELETKLIKAEKKDFHIGIKYVNETKHNIEVLDSTWFTTIVRSEGFAVGGHFRFQPCGEGRSERKLIWISPFEKHGYVRKARIETLNQ